MNLGDMFDQWTWNLSYHVLTMLAKK